MGTLTGEKTISCGVGSDVKKPKFDVKKPTKKTTTNGAFVWPSKNKHRFWKIRMFLCLRRN